MEAKTLVFGCDIYIRYVACFVHIYNEDVYVALLAVCKNFHFKFSSEKFVCLLTEMAGLGRLKRYGQRFTSNALRLQLCGLPANYGSRSYLEKLCGMIDPHELGQIAYTEQPFPIRHCCYCYCLGCRFNIAIILQRNGEICDYCLGNEILKFPHLWNKLPQISECRGEYEEEHEKELYEEAKEDDRVWSLREEIADAHADSYFADDDVCDVNQSRSDLRVRKGGKGKRNYCRGAKVSIRKMQPLGPIPRIDAGDYTWYSVF